MSTAIVWFRQDLRCQDNPALATACEQHQWVIPIYIAGKNPLESVGAAQGWWLHHSLLALQKELKKQGLDLALKHGLPLVVLKELIKEFQVDAIYWNRGYEPTRIEQDKIIKSELKTLGLTVKSFNGYLLNEPWTVKNKAGENFKIFTPFWKQCLRQIEIPSLKTIKHGPRYPALKSDQLSDWNLLPSRPNWAKEFADYWKPGETSATQKLNFFIENHLQNYKNYRDEPFRVATSYLSPHLHFGEISPWQIWRAMEEAKLTKNYHLGSIECFQSELGWREFSYHLLYHYPNLPQQNFRQEFDNFSWHNDHQNLLRWQRGLTGYPIVDAGMRELWRTGYMHNRVRMIVASFLVKDLLIDWRKGAEWFLYTLLDADLASNSTNWQWVAGSGVDSAPYFRIFNPVLQGEKFDRQGEYVRKWVPELTSLPLKWLHKPWEAPAHELPIRLGSDYPYPLVEHNSARQLALEKYKSIK
ncbi:MULTISPECIES: cryptochrome/photolyase family protein [Legionella]|uniref:Deoxyribodipyrimidine photo-lyase n=1 Tax=Legionella drozanskii LLAP-1 TaxID=1212489 RepID=A0A0W0SXF7_9GAMM|nr:MULTISPECIES: deoxyribodipyrimidine photo-lyase [Legionella]KTC88046.1 deoxyribodipyrimidine photolyase phrB [Legionella drozanskii LLAP-1]PJE07366.1 MAG: deoxyribodipyrimidine photo-lyase [Legionella sp.]